MTRQKIAIIEDELDIQEIIIFNLKREGFDPVSAADGAQALELVKRHRPALVLLDLMLPSLDGLEVVRRLKADSVTYRIPILIVSAKGEESDVVLGLGLGADDYITKPFKPKELVARIRAVLRRTELSRSQGGDDTVIVDDLVIDPRRHDVRIQGRSERFTATEFRLLHLLASRPGRVFTRDQLLARVIGGSAIVVDRNIDVHVRAIRKKLGEFSYLIETIRGVGYRFRDQES